jgi:hypothetical protein
MGSVIERSERFLLRVSIKDARDVKMAWHHARQLAQLEGFPDTARDALVSSVADVAGEMVAVGTEGEILLGVTQDQGKRGIVVLTRVPGPQGPVVRMRKWLACGATARA